MTEIVGRYVEVGGVRTCYESSGDGQRPLVCIHTAGMDSTEWRYNLPQWGERGIRAIALDLPGHGKSDLPHAGPVEDLADYAEFVWEFARVLGLDRPAVTGCSIGGCTT